MTGETPVQQSGKSNLICPNNLRRYFAWLSNIFLPFFLLTSLTFCTNAVAAASGANPLKPSDVTAQARAGESVYYQSRGPVTMRRLPDGSEILTATGGVYISQQLKDGVFVELRALNAVIFFAVEQATNEPAARAETEVKMPEPNQPVAPSALEKLGQYVQGVYLEGDVVLQTNLKSLGSEYKIKAARIYYDFNRQSALILDGVISILLPDPALPFYVRAQQIQQLSLGRFSARDIKLSNDEFNQPHVCLGARQVDITARNEKGAVPASMKDVTGFSYDMRDVTVDLDSLPVFWWPWAQGNTSKADIPLESLHVGSSSEFGTTFESEWNLPWLLGLPQPAGVDSVLHIDEFSSRGPGGGIDLDYTSQYYFGELETYLLGDSGEDRLGRFSSRRNLEPAEETRGRATWRHRQYFPYDWQGNFEISYLSDPYFLESWRERQFDTDKEQETAIYFKQQRDNWAFDFLNKFHLNDFDYTTTELPTAGFHLAGQDLFDLFTYYHDGYISHLRERAGPREVPDFSSQPQPSILPDNIDQDDYAFGLSRHELTLPLHFGPLNVMPTGIGTIVFDESRYTDTIFPDPRYGRDRQDNCFIQGAGGLRVNTSVWHVDNNIHSRLWDVDTIRHIVTPQFSVFAVDSNLEDIPSRDVFNFALQHRWQTKRGLEGNKYSTDWFRLNTSVTLVDHDVDDFALPNKFFFSSPEPQFTNPGIINADFANLSLARRELINQNLADHADADWTWLISETTVHSGYINYNIHDGVLSETNMDIALQRTPRLGLFFGHRFLHDGDPFNMRNANFLTAGATYKLNRKYTIALAHQQDIQVGATAYTRFTVIRKFIHWYGALSLGHDATRGTTSLMVSFWPEGLDRIAFGTRRFTRLAP